MCVWTSMMGDAIVAGGFVVAQEDQEPGRRRSLVALNGSDHLCCWRMLGGTSLQVRTLDPWYKGEGVPGWRIAKPHLSR